MSPRDLPPLDLLRGFEAAARHLSFTRAADELFLTQSAVSRQVQALEEHLGVPLFQRRHRALLLTDAGQILQRAATDMLAQLAEITREIRGLSNTRLISVTTVVSFASLWLVPRLPLFRERHPNIDVRIAADNNVVDLTRDRVDIAVRYISPARAPASATRLFGEDVLPMCSPELLKDRKRPLRQPSDLVHHTLLHDMDAKSTPWLDWSAWLAAHGAHGLRPAAELHFSYYDQMVRAAIDGQGVVLGRLPLLSRYIERKHLVAPFRRADGPGRMPLSDHAFFVFPEARAAARPEVRAFVEWIREAAAQSGHVTVGV